MKFKDYVFGWNRMHNHHDTYVVRVGDRITSRILPNIKFPLAVAISGGFAGKTLKQLGFKEGDVCCYTKAEDFDEVPAPDKNQTGFNRLPLNPIFSKPLPLP